MTSLDVVTVYHRPDTAAMAEALRVKTLALEPEANWIAVSNIEVNRGFAAASNLGAAQGGAPVILFLNPDASVHGPFVKPLVAALQGDVVIAGCDFAKPQAEIASWGLRRWVCGAAMGVRRDWFTAVGGFDQRYIWSFEDTHLCRLAESTGRRVLPLDLPIAHASPTDDGPLDAAYKAHHFARAAALYRKAWPTPTRAPAAKPRARMPSWTL